MDPIQAIQQNLRAASAPSSNNKLAHSILQQVRARLDAARSNEARAAGATGALDGYYLDESSISALAAATGGDAVKTATANMFHSALKAWKDNPAVFGGRTPADYVNSTVRARLAAVRSEQEQDAAEFSTPGLVLQTGADMLTETPLRAGYDTGKVLKALFSDAPEFQRSALFTTVDDPIVKEAKAGNVPWGQFSRALVGTRAINEGNRPERVSAAGYFDEATGEYVDPDLLGGLGKYVGSGLNLLYKATLAQAALQPLGVTDRLVAMTDRAARFGRPGALVASGGRRAASIAQGLAGTRAGQALSRAKGAAAEMAEGLASRGVAGSVAAGGLEQLPTMVTLGALNRVQQKPTLTAALDPVSVVRDDVVNSFIAGGIERFLLSNTLARGHKNLQRAIAEVGGESDDFMLARNLFDDPASLSMVQQVGMSRELRDAVKEVAPRFLREYGAANVVSPVAEFIAGYTADRLRGEDHESAIANGLFFGLFDASAAIGRGKAMHQTVRALDAEASRVYAMGDPMSLRHSYMRAEPVDPMVPAETRPGEGTTPMAPGARVRVDDAAFDQFGMPREGVEAGRNIQTGFDETGYVESVDAERMRNPPVYDIPLMQFDPSAGLLDQVRAEAEKRGIKLKNNEVNDAEKILKRVEADEKKKAAAEKREAKSRDQLVKGLNPEVKRDPRKELSKDQLDFLEEFAANLDNGTTPIVDIVGNPGEVFSKAELDQYYATRREELRAPRESLDRTEAGEVAALRDARLSAEAPLPAPRTESAGPDVYVSKPLEDHTRQELQRVASRLGIPSQKATKADLLATIRDSGRVGVDTSGERGLTGADVARELRKARTYMPTTARARAAVSAADPNSLSEVITKPPKKLYDILKAGETFLGVPISHRQAGTPSGAQGQFSSSGVLVQQLNSPELLAHEFGHGTLERIIGRDKIPGPVYTELVDWASQNIADASTRPERELFDEGYATYTAMRALDDPAVVRALFPDTWDFHETAAFFPRKKKAYDDWMRSLREFAQLGGAARAAAMTAEQRSFYKRTFTGVSDLLASIFRPDVKPTRYVDEDAVNINRISDPDTRARLIKAIRDAEVDPTKSHRMYSRSAASGYVAANVEHGVVRPGEGVIPGTMSLSEATRPALDAVRGISAALKREKGAAPRAGKIITRVIDTAMEYLYARRAVELYDGRKGPNVDIAYAEKDPATGVQSVEKVRDYVDAVERQAAGGAAAANTLIAQAIIQVADNVSGFVDLQIREDLRAVGMEHILDGALGSVFSKYIPQAGFDPERPLRPLWEPGRMVDTITGNAGMVANGMEAVHTRLAALHQAVITMKRDRAMLSYAKLQQEIHEALRAEGKAAGSRKLVEGKTKNAAKESVIKIVDDFSGADLVKAAKDVEAALSEIKGITRSEIDAVLANPETWAFFVPVKTKKLPDSARKDEITVYDPEVNRHRTLQLSHEWAKFYYDSADVGDGNFAIRMMHAATSWVRFGATGVNFTFALVDPIRNAMTSAIAANLGMQQYGVKTYDGFIGAALDTVAGTPLRFTNALARSYAGIAFSAVDKLAPELGKRLDSVVQSGKDSVRAHLGAPLSKALQASPLGRRLDTWAKMTFGAHAEFNPLSFDTLGGAMSGFYGPDVDSVKRASEKIYHRGMSPSAIKQGLTDVFTASELAPKNAAMVENYNRLRDAGYDHTEATKIAYLEAKDVQDFQYTGMIGRLMNKLTPYFSAQLVGVDKMYRTMAQPFMRAARGAAPSRVTKTEAAQAWARAVTMVTLPSLFEWLLNKDKQWWRDIPEEQRYSHWHISSDDGETVARFPKTHEVGMLFGTLPVALLDTYYQRADEISELPDQFRRAFTATVANLIPGDWYDPSVQDGVPFSVPKGIVSLSPALFQPITEVYFNRSSYTGRPIVPEYMRTNLMSEDQKRDYSTLVAQKVGELLDTSPLVIDHLLNSHTGNLYGRVVAGAGDASKLFQWFMRGESPEELKDYSPLSPAQRLPIISAFYREGPYYRETASERWLYDVNEDVNQLMGSFELAIAEGNREKALALLPSIPANYEAFADLVDLQREVRQATRGDRQLAAQMRRKLAPIFRSAVLEYQRNLEND